MIAAPIAFDAPQAEAYRALRTTLTYARLPEDRRVVLFTSARRGEGKSTTAANFAAVCAYGENRTLLVDADLRNPQVHRIFGVDGSSGLSTALRRGDRVELASMTQPTDNRFLDVLVAGPPSAHAGELLSRSLFAEIVEEARAAYEWVVVDSPPVLPIADAAIAQRAVEGVVLIVDLRRTPVAVAQRARDLLHAVGAPLIGVVANNATGRASAYGYGRYPS